MSLLATGQQNVSIFFKNIDTLLSRVDGDDTSKKHVDEILIHRHVVICRLASPGKAAHESTPFLPC
jgi:hypothetical protein